MSLGNGVERVELINTFNGSKGVINFVDLRQEREKKRDREKKESVKDRIKSNTILMRKRALTMFVFCCALRHAT